MTRIEDETGVSGKGKVLEGVVFSDGTCVTRWIAENSPGRSTSIWDSVGSFVAIHVAPHPGNKTILKFSDGEVYEHTDVKNTAIKPKRQKKIKSPKLVVQEVPLPVGQGDNVPSTEAIPQPESKKE
jgi:hypothetical protein